MKHWWSPRAVVAVISYLVIGICLVVLFVQNQRQDAFDARRASDIAAAQARTVKCVVKAIRDDAAQTKALRDVARMRDQDLAAAIRAMVALVDIRVLGGVNQNTATTQAAEQFIVQANHFLEQSQTLDEARDANPVPEKICGVLIDTEQDQ